MNDWANIAGVEGFVADKLARGFGVVLVTMALMLALSVRMVNNYD